jgi:hypothetical protein
MKSKELAIAIDTDMLARNRSGMFNPHFCAVPSGLTKQEVLALVYKSAIEYSLHLLGEEPDLPNYDYLWHGVVTGNGEVHGCESDRLTPLSEDQIKRMILNARRKNPR